MGYSKYSNQYSDEEKRIAGLKLPIELVYKIYIEAGFTRSKQCLRKWRYDNGIRESDFNGGKLPRHRLKRNSKQVKRFPLGVREWLLYG